jgi:hypothetical protein
MRWTLVVAATLMIWSELSGVVHAQTVSLDKLQVRLWYQESGRLSDNIAPPAVVSLWNTVIGEGDAEEIANNAIFTAQIRTDGEQNVDQQLTLSATDSSGNLLAKRTFANILTSQTGVAVLPLWVGDVGCAGTVLFSARIGSESRSFSIDFACGE